MEGVQTDFIDIGGKESYKLSKKRVVTIPKAELRDIKLNPGKLTKEGVLTKIQHWSVSHNNLQQAKYIVMLYKCKKLAPSENTKDGGIVLSKQTQKRGSGTLQKWSVIPKAVVVTDPATGEEISIGLNVKALKAEVKEYLANWFEKHQIRYDSRM